MFIFKVGMIRHFQFVHDCECMLLFEVYWSGIRFFYLIITLDFEGVGSEFKTISNGDHVFLNDLSKFWKDVVNVLRESLSK